MRKFHIDYPRPSTLEEVLAPYIGQKNTPATRLAMQLEIKKFVGEQTQGIVTRDEIEAAAKAGLTYEDIKDYLPFYASKEDIEKIMAPYLTPIGRKLYRK